MTEEQERENKIEDRRRQLEDLCREMQECADQMEASDEFAGNGDLPAWLAALRDPDRTYQIRTSGSTPTVLMRMPPRAHELYKLYAERRGDLFNAKIVPLIRTEA